MQGTVSFVGHVPADQEPAFLGTVVLVGHRLGQRDELAARLQSVEVAGIHDLRVSLPIHEARGAAAERQEPASQRLLDHQAR